jgi:NAD(P)-dependent dehydrogenase (short-subunit alcohol dehydrogenase family)
MGELEGKVAIITGAGRGIGAALARRFTAEGAAVILNDLGGAPDGSATGEQPAQELAQQIRDAGGKAVADGGDISEAATGTRLVELALKEFGALDVVVNAAGILRDRMIFNMTESDWDAVIRVHLRGHYSTVRPASAHWRSLKNPDGHFRIINFSSISGLDGSPGQANYAAAKMGVIGLTYSLAQGLARYGVTANAVAPAAATRLTATIPTDKELGVINTTDADSRDSPDQIAPLALYLASERSDWLTGRVLSAQGYEVGLYENPKVIRQIAGTQPWEQDVLAGLMEKNFRPVANGLPDSIFSVQGGR